MSDKDGGTEQFALLLNLATQIVDKQFGNQSKSLIIIHTSDKKWLVAITPLNNRQDYPIPTTGGFETIEDALKEFVINPQAFVTRSKS